MIQQILHRSARLSAMGFLAGSLVGCLTLGDETESDEGGLPPEPGRQNPNQVELAKVPVKVLWRQIKATPPTYVPALMPMDAPTDALNGEWSLDSETGAQYFIPLAGAGKAEYDDVLAALPKPGQAPVLAPDGALAGN